jgi:hypothetical protein
MFFSLRRTLPSASYAVTSVVCPLPLLHRSGSQSTAWCMPSVCARHRTGRVGQHAPASQMSSRSSKVPPGVRGLPAHFFDHFPEAEQTNANHKKQKKEEEKEKRNTGLAQLGSMLSSLLQDESTDVNVSVGDTTLLSVSSLSSGVLRSSVSQFFPHRSLAPHSFSIPVHIGGHTPCCTRSEASCWSYSTKRRTRFDPHFRLWLYRRVFRRYALCVCLWVCM